MARVRTVSARMTASVRVTAGVAALLVTVGCGAGSSGKDVSGRDVAIHTLDGVDLAATLYPVDHPKPPGLILVHMLGRDRRTWAPLISALRQAGYLCLAIDMRGHGGSTRKGEQALTYRNFTTEDWQGVLEDIDAAKQALLKAGANPDNLGLVGASIGANLVLRYAEKHSDIQALVLLSPGLEYQGVGTEAAVVAYGKRPVLLMTGEGDSYAAASCATLKGLAKGFCELRSYAGSAHGTDLLASSPNAVQQILQWLDPILKASSAGAPKGGEAPAGP